MKEALSRGPWCPYQEFVLRTEEGQQRLHIWTDMAIRALEGEREAFLKNAAYSDPFRPPIPEDSGHPPGGR